MEHEIRGESSVEFEKKIDLKLQRFVHFRLGKGQAKVTMIIQRDVKEWLADLYGAISISVCCMLSFLEASVGKGSIPTSS
jgi:hypothetical protein